MAELVIIECSNCGNAFKGDLNRSFLCPKCRSLGHGVHDSRTTSVFRKRISDEEKKEANLVEQRVEFKIEPNMEKQNILNNVTSQISDIVSENKKADIKKAERESKIIVSNNNNNNNSEVILRLDRLEAKQTIIESLLKEVLLKLK